MRYICNVKFKKGGYIMSKKIYSVIISHEADVHENYLFLDRAKAVAKMEKVVEGWRNGEKYRGEGFSVHRFDEDRCRKANFTPQYATKMGYWYADGEWEYGSVELLECEIEGDMPTEDTNSVKIIIPKGCEVIITTK
jgi:hypothetical protein